KSTLLNRIARRDAAIVSPVPGTTRDVIEVHLDLDGYPVTLVDTAGIRDSNDPVEQEGVRRARARAADADLALWGVDGSAGEAGAGGRSAIGLVGRDPGMASSPAPTAWTIRSKVDLLRQQRNEHEPGLSSTTFSISAQTGEGMNLLMDALTGHVAGQLGG